MKHPIDLEHWNRKEHFLFFGSMDDPFLAHPINQGENSLIL